MSEDSMLVCLIAFVLGYLVARMMRGIGLSVGGDQLNISSSDTCVCMESGTAWGQKYRYVCGKALYDLHEGYANTVPNDDLCWKNPVMDNCYDLSKCGIKFKSPKEIAKGTSVGDGTVAGEYSGDFWNFKCNNRSKQTVAQRDTCIKNYSKTLSKKERDDIDTSVKQK